jgi:type IV secretory pathway VirB2 component (pilin)
MDRVLGVYLTPMVMLTDTPEEARRLAAFLRYELGSEPFAGRIGRVVTIDDMVPARQREKIAVLAAIRKELTPKMRAGLTPEQREQVERLLPEDLRPITLADLPRTFTLGLRELDGSAGKTVLIYPIQGSWTWDGEQMRRVVEELRSAAVAAPRTQAPARLAGSLPLSSDIIDAIAQDGPLASALALLGVVAVVLVLLEKKRALLVSGALVAGVLWMAALSRFLQVRINFANFIAFPITFGIGVDYSVNVVSRYVQDGSKDILAAVRSTGSAVALCSLTTIIGYSSLLMAQNQALFNFGVLAVLGELSCLSAALVSLPALVRLLERRRAEREVPQVLHAEYSGLAPEEAAAKMRRAG